MGGAVQREPFTPIRLGISSSDSSDGDIDAKIDRAQAYIASRGISSGTVDSQSSGTGSSISGPGAGAESKGLIASHVTWDRDAPTPPRHRRGCSESHPFLKEDSQSRLEHHRSSSSKDGGVSGGAKADKGGDDRAQRPKPLAWTPGRRRAADAGLWFVVSFRSYFSNKTK